MLYKFSLILIYLVFASCFCLAQPNYTAQQVVAPFTKPFQPGMNLGYYIGFSDEALATLSIGSESLGVEGVGARALRPSLPEDFLELYGYDFRVAAFQAYAQLGMTENTLIIGFPSDAHRDTTNYCPGGLPSTMFKNLQTPIWDNGENGTPVNDTNFYALYLWKLGNLYQPYVKFWEVWNEPGFDYSGICGYSNPGSDCNWWDNDPDPCDYKLRAPIEQYIRTLRISWEVLKTIDSTAQICVSGTGYPSFLDAILRNTDNPIDGTVTPEFPFGGGAYFDCIGFHSYPHFDGALRAYNDEIQDFDYFRHSDAAMRGLMRTRNIMQEVLDEYGFEGTTYPEKNWVITECNVPRKQIGDFIGSELAQRNFVMKAWVEAARQDFKTLHLYKIAEEETYAAADYEFEVMGLYQQLNYNSGYNQLVTESGIANSTTSLLLYNKRYDSIKTAALNLPSNIDGAAFIDDIGSYTYVLWAKTETDQSEVAAASYSFPLNFVADSLLLRHWDFSFNYQTLTSNGQNLQLTSTPQFFSERQIAASAWEGCSPLTVQFSAPTTVGTWHWSFENATPATATGSLPEVVFESSGAHAVFAWRGTDTDTFETVLQNIYVKSGPTANFSLTLNGPIIQTENASSFNSDTYAWDFGDGSTSDLASPLHVYSLSDTFSVQLIAKSACGSDTLVLQQPIVVPTATQPPFLAIDTIAPFAAPFAFGANMIYQSGWNDSNISLLLSGDEALGVKGLAAHTLKIQTPEYFFDFWGYDIREQEFEFYQNHQLENNTITLCIPGLAHRDSYEYCPDKPGQLFSALYEDIWLPNQAGSAVNSNNHFAQFVWGMAQQYKDQVTFYEVLDGPGYDPEDDNAWKPSGVAGNWWDNNPAPCDYALNAPIMHYIRMLRIAYEVIHAADPVGYVVVNGIGEPSFLDVLLRNTDNPADGSASSVYPHGGGAYIDAIGLTNFPFLDGSTGAYDLAAGQIVNKRHSDAAMQSIVRQQDKFNIILNNYGFNGQTHPQKLWVSTAANIPFAPIDAYFGGELAQLNFQMKSRIEAERRGVSNWIVEKLAETANPATTTDVIAACGLYAQLPNTPDFEASVARKSAIGLATLSTILQGCTYDLTRSNALLLPSNMDGAAYKTPENKYHYVLWAKTSEDLSENAYAEYVFPSAFGINNLSQRYWDYWSTGSVFSASDSIAVAGTPIIFSESDVLFALPSAQFSAISPTTGCPGLSVQFSSLANNVDSLVWHFEGGQPEFSNAQNPMVTYIQGGPFGVQLTAFNTVGQATNSLDAVVNITPLQAVDFNFVVNGADVAFDAPFEGNYAYLWQLGDGVLAYNLTPTHTYEADGNYTVRLIMSNECGADTTTKIVTIAAAPQALVAFNETNCSNSPVVFSAIAAPAIEGTTFVWDFPAAQNSGGLGAEIETFYASSGLYNWSLVVTNSYGAYTVTGQIEIVPNAFVFLDSTLCAEEEFCLLGTSFCFQNGAAMPVLINLNTYLGCDSTVQLQINWLPPVPVSQIDTSACSDLEICIAGTIYCFQYGAAMPTLLSFTNFSGCDSTVLLQIDWLSLDTILLTDSIYSGQTYPFNGAFLSSSGDYEAQLTNAFGCDSLVSLSLSVIDTTTATQNSNTLVEIAAQPNPFYNYLVISGLQSNALYKFKLYEPLGASFFEHQAMSNSSGVVQLTELSALPSGAFVLICTSPTGEMSKLQLVHYVP